MSAPVDVLAVLDAARDFIVEGPASDKAWRVKGELMQARDAVAALLRADRALDISKASLVEASNRIASGSSLRDDDFRRQALAQHAFDRAVAARREALARLGWNPEPAGVTGGVAEVYDSMGVRR
jgi:hypothetical protein